MFSNSGDLIFKEFTHALKQDPENINWSLFIESLDGIRETDLIFENGRIYIRKTDRGYLVILMGLFTPPAMLRLNCDVLLPALAPAKPAKKWGLFLRK
jgi:hypothetical protein